MSKERAEKIILKLNEDFRATNFHPDQNDFNQYLLGIISGLVIQIQDLKSEIEGGPEPVRDWKSDRAIAAIWPTPKPAEDSPERLRERREALGWTTAYAGHWVAWFDHTDVERAECGRGVPAFVARYAAALSAEEARRAAKAKPVDIGYVPTDRERYPERPAPRFKVGDWVRWPGDEHAWQVTRVTWLNDCWVCSSATLQSAEFGLEPASPPAPEVVDVPRRRRIMSVRSRAASAAMVRHTLPWLDDLARRLTGMAEHFARQAKHGGRAWESNALSETTCRDGVEAVTALRAMLAAIDARQGGAS